MTKSGSPGRERETLRRGVSSLRRDTSAQSLLPFSRVKKERHLCAESPSPCYARVHRSAHTPPRACRRGNTSAHTAPFRAWATLRIQHRVEPGLLCAERCPVVHTVDAQRGVPSCTPVMRRVASLRASRSIPPCIKGASLRASAVCPSFRASAVCPPFRASV